MIRNNRNTRSVLASSLSSVLKQFGSQEIKSAIGDSINNNRVPTVSQMSRFLKTRRSPALIQAGRRLDALYPVLSAKAKSVARSRSSRTDALDINEFILALRSL